MTPPGKSRIRLLWKGAKEVVYEEKLWKKIGARQVETAEAFAVRQGAKATRRVDPRFSAQLQKLLTGGFKRFESSWLHRMIAADLKVLERDLKAVLTRGRVFGKYARSLVAGLNTVEWALLRQKAGYITRTVRERASKVLQVKGLIHEIGGIRRLFGEAPSARAREIMDEMKKMVKAAPDRAWDPNIKMVERAYAHSKDGGGEVGDLLFFVMADAKDPKRGIWILGIGNQKSAGNAHHLLSHNSFFSLDPKALEEGIPKYGEGLGQSAMDVERIWELGVEIPGYGKFSRTTGKGEFPLKISWSSTLRIGVVPPDTLPAKLNQLRNLENKERNFRLLISELPDREAAELAEEVVRAVE